jgi:hypothetical protein
VQKRTPDDFKYRFAAPAEEIIVPTALMRETINRTSTVHPGITVWYGESRVGKSTTAKYMVDKIAEAYDPHNPHAYRALHYEVGEIANWSGNEQKKGIKSLYCATLGRIDEGLYRHDPPESLAAQLVHGLIRKNIQIICVDEAGALSLGALRGMILVYDIAKNLKHPLSLVFIGMDDLPTKVKYSDQVYKRIVEWCFFEAYSLEETGRFLSDLHPHFQKLNYEDPEQFEQAECIYNMFGGFPGLIVPFLKKLEHYQKLEPEEITVTYLRSIQLRTIFDEKHSVAKSHEIYRGKPPKDTRTGYKRDKGSAGEKGRTDDEKSSKKPAKSGKSAKKASNTGKPDRKRPAPASSADEAGQ